MQYDAGIVLLVNPAVPVIRICVMFSYTGRRSLHRLIDVIVIIMRDIQYGIGNLLTDMPIGSMPAGMPIGSLPDVMPIGNRPTDRQPARRKSDW